MFIVKTRPGAAPLAIGPSLSAEVAGATRGKNRTAQVRTPKGKTDAQFRRELEADPSVEYVSPVYFRSVQEYDPLPNDPYYNDPSEWTDGAGYYNCGRNWWLRNGVHAFTIWDLLPAFNRHALLHK